MSLRRSTPALMVAGLVALAGLFLPHVSAAQDPAGEAAAIASLPEASGGFLDLGVDLMLISDGGTEKVDRVQELLVPGEDGRLNKDYTLTFGQGRGAVLRLSLAWSVVERGQDLLRLQVDSRAVLTTAVGFQSQSVGQVQTRERLLEALPGQVHLHELWVSSDLRLRLLASFRYDEKRGGTPIAGLLLEDVTFRIRALEGEGWRRRPVRERTTRSIGGKEVGFYFQSQEPVRVPEPPEPEPEDDSGLLVEAGNEEWMERNLTDPVRIPNRKKVAKQREAMRERLERGELTEEDLAILEQERERKDRVAMRVERADLKLQPLYTGERVLRARLKLEADFVYPDLDREARVRLDRVVDLERAETLTFDLLSMAGKDPATFPAHYVLDIKAFW